ncbi:hypothetical protein [uncultured Jatrophihabitans sp.]|uniref:hypothetical protein n=1 Tax=uncultured Jatrophihabitans sp. TaxID=1610747 RepID=UPI0035CC8B8D
MTASSAPGSIDPNEAKETAKQTKDAAAGVAQHGKQAAQDVAQTGKQAAQDVAAQTKDQAGDLLGKTREQLTEQAQVQQSTLVDTLRSLADQLGSMTQHTDESGAAVDFVKQAGDRARNSADWLNQREPNEVLDEARRFGRERPGAFLLASALAGVAAGRLTRGVVAEHTDGGSIKDAVADATGPADDATRATPPPVGSRPAPAPLGGTPRHEAAANHRVDGRYTS